ncbi:[NiFe] hydrogenase metallocenter assembly protein HypC [hydrothermal vent metagenome]|uniref:[NiFe] hydrogenase metallocenter assembly protein HypC n=1 Tax=hydrothermal vent metagenome TaxID=652676 RepID=A0A3B1DVG6_9ZZZZ
MCLSVPGKVLEITEEDGFKMGNIDFSGITKRICLEYVPDIQVGEYALVHVGFAISKIDEKEAAKTLKLLRELEQMRDESKEDSSP